MLRLSRRLDYAVLAVAHLADPHLKGPVSSRALAERSRVPPAVLANILKDLTRVGVIRSVRGAHGGYELEGRPQDLSVGELIRRVEGAPKLVECVEDGTPSDAASQDGAPADGARSSGGCELQQRCPIKAPLRKLHDRIHEVLDELSFEQLAVSGWWAPPELAGSGVSPNESVPGAASVGTAASESDENP